MQSLLNLVNPEGDEVCGVILKDGTVEVRQNLHHDPRDNFAMDCSDFDDLNIVATFHTHPRSSPNLTVADYRAFRSFPRLRHYIASQTEIWCYRMEADILLRDDNYYPPRLPAGPSPDPD